MDHQNNCLFITFVEKEGPFLKIWGQTDKNTSLYIEQVLHTFTGQYDNGYCIPQYESIQVGDLISAKYNDNKYYRARVTSFLQHNKFIEVNFVDYGNHDIVPLANIRTLEIFDKRLLSIPPQAHSFLLSEAVCLGGEWDDTILEEICKEIRYSEVNFSIVAQVTRHFLVRLFVSTNDLAILLIDRGLMRHTSLTTQEAVLLAMMSRAGPTPTPPVQHNLATYKAYTLEPGKQYEVYVSYVSDGPSNFSVQLKQTEEALAKLMKEINSMNLTPLDGVPVPGTVCLARCIEDEHICRAVVTNEVDGQYKVFYVDFGNFEVVPIDVLYEIPFKYVIPKVMAIRFALAGVDKTSITFDMLCAFKQFVDDRLIHMKVLPMATRTGLPHCELWDPETQLSALDILNQAAGASYPDAIIHSRGFCQVVKVSYVFSCNRFFTQLKSKQEELQNLMLELQSSCCISDPISPEKIKVGLPCCALFEGDGQWYRSQIVEVINSQQVKVHYVDFGNDEVVNIMLLRPIEGKHLTVLRPQAIECCLNGYQNMGPDTERDNLLEELILEQDFTMKVVETKDKKALVELIDLSNYNVASLLLDKMAAARSQVSPLLVQAGNVIEHRKYPSSQPERFDRRKPNERPPKPWANSDNFWRQDSKGHRNKSTDSEELNENNGYKHQNNDNNGFRQQNKGFRNDRNNRRDNDFNSSSESDSKFNKSFNRNNDNGDSWRQNNKDFNKNRPNRDTNNRNNEWGGGDNNHDRKSFSPREKNDWKNSRNNDRNYDWNNTDKSDWNNHDNEKKSFNSRGGREFQDGGKNFRDKDNSFKKNNRSNSDGDSWNADSKPVGRGDFKRAPSEVSSNGSEKGGKRGFRDNQRNQGNKRNDNFKKSPPKQSWSGPDKSTEVPNSASSTDKFKKLDLSQLECNVTVSWFHNPSHFYCLIEENQNDFKKMMEEIQEAYKDRTPSTAVANQPVIGLFPEDNVLYRAQVIEQIGSQFKVYYVDFGNVAVIDKVWPIEKRFMALPAQAVCCRLDGINPVGDKWIQSTDFGQYFNRPQFHCKFIPGESECVGVKLESDGENIGDLLIRDGLAQAPVQTPSIEIPFLVGQQFRAMLIGFESLANFGMCLQDGTMLTCSVFNLAKSTETFEDALKAKLEQILIVYVDDVREDNTLEVTLYNSDGTKIKLIDKDEEAYETVELICPYLVCRPSLSGIVSHAEDSTIYVQPENCTQNIEYLLNAIFEAYDSTTLETPLVPVEGYVYAVKSLDGNWYRARVTSIDESKVTVNYIDYGNSETVETVNLRELSSNFMEFDIPCVPVTVQQVPAESLIGHAVTLSIKFTENGIEGTVESSTVDETAPPEQVLKQEVSEPVQTEVISSPEITTIVEEPTVKSEHQTGVIVSHIDSPSEFYLQLVESSNSIEQLQAELQEHIAEMDNMENPTVGVLCAAPYSLDQQWYRAQVLDADSDITTVRFVDYGNTDVLDNCITRVKTLWPNLLSIEMHATRCRLQIKPVEDEWSATAAERFEQLCGEEPITAEFVSQDEKTNYVKLYTNGKSIGDILISENLAVADEIVADESQGTKGFMSHLNSPSEFWIQLETCIDELEWIAEQLSGAESFKELEDQAPGTLCAALFPDDQMWYRARILSNTVAGIEVLFVDYGNSCTSCSLRELPEELVMMAPLAQKCSLQKPEKLQNWGPEMVRRFSEVADDGRTTFIVKKIKTGETALVDLMTNGENVISLILPQTENVEVKTCESLDELVVVKDGAELPIKYTLEKLPDLVWNQESVNKFNEIVCEINGIFQAELVSENCVRLYTEGCNDVRLILNGTKTPTSSPVKVKTEVVIDEKHSNHEEEKSENLNDGIKEMVSEMIDQALENNTNEVVHPIVNDIISNSCDNLNESTNLEVIKNAIDEIVTKVTSDNSNECDNTPQQNGIVSGINENGTETS